MIDLNIQDYDLPVYAYDFRQRALLVFDGVEVTGESLKQPFRKIWASQPISSFLSAIKPAIFWSPSPVEAAAPYVFAKKGNWIYRFSRIDYQMARKQGLKGVFGAGSFTNPEDLVSISPCWFATVIEAYHWDTA
jgi:hypothetical protein